MLPSINHCGYFFFLLALVVISPLKAQIVPDIRGNSTVRGGADGLPEKERGQEDFFSERDTFGVFSFYAENPNKERAYSDSLLTRYTHQYDLARQQSIDFFHLGPLGSATLPILYQPEYRKGFDIGIHQYDFYQIRAKHLTYHRLKSPFTDLTYTQVGEQSDTYFKGSFSRNFADGLSVSIDYQSIAMVGSQNHFPNQNARHTAISTGLWYHSKNERYDGFLSYAANTAEQQDNGGIQVEPTEETPSTAITFLDDAETRHAHREILYTHYYRFGGNPDTTTNKLRRSYTLDHQIGYLGSTYKFTDDFGSSLDDIETLFYATDFLQDERGVRYFLEHQKLENTFNLSTYRLKGALGNKAQEQKDLLKVGLNHAIHWVDLETSDTTLNNLFLNGQINFNPNDRIKLNTYAHFGLLDNLGDYRLEGTLELDFKKLGRLNAQFVNQLNTPNLVQSRFVVTQREVWNLDLDKTLSTTLSGTYKNDNLEFSATVAYHLINNYIYFDTLGIVNQTSSPINILQVILQKNFRVGSFHLDNTMALQEISGDLIPRPSLFSKHSLYYGGKWFKVLNVRVGLDLRFTTSYEAPYYHPLTGQFQLPRRFTEDIVDRRTIPFYPAADAFFSMQITKFRAFAKWENLNQILQNQQYYQIAYYPQWEGGLRLGIKWRFIN